MVTLALDTDVVRDIWDDDERRAAVDRLIDLASTGEVDLAVTRHVEEDVPRAPLADRIRDLPVLGIRKTGGVFVIGVSRIGGPDGVGSDAFDTWWRQLNALRTDGEPRLPGATDYHHLHAHYIRGRDVFVTWDTAILRLRAELEATFGIRVMTPSEALTLVA